MANIQHSTLPSSSVHEPKHITINGTTASGKVITNSSSSNATSEYRRLTQGDLSELEVVLQARHEDASTAFTFYLPATFGGLITGFAAVVNQAIAGSSNTYELAIDGTTVTGSIITLDTSPGTGGTAGDVVTATPSAANSFSNGQFITVEATTVGNTDAGTDVTFLITLQRS